MTSFDTLGLSERLVQRLHAEGLTVPTPIQAQAIPQVLAGRDVMGLAQTGTGKTAAFGLPLLHILSAKGRKPAPRTVRGLVLAPTRELAKQITDTLVTYARKSHLKVGLVVGGASINAQANRLERGLDILVATPGRLMDLLERQALTLDETRFLVLDEADQMLDLGFIHALRKIARLLPAERQTLLFSATMPKQMAEIAGAYLTDPVRIEVSPPGRAADKITQSVHFVEQSEKSALLRDLLDGHRDELALVFARTKHGAERLKKQLDAAGFAAGSIHGNKSQGQRQRALKAFREGEHRVLVATDVAARGIDIPQVRHVYNYDLPNVAENYVHRIGRTARAGAEGAAIAFCSPAEIDDLRAIEKVLSAAIPVGGGAPWAPEKPANGNGAGKGPKSRGRGKPRRRPGKPGTKAQGGAPRRRAGGQGGGKRRSGAAANA